MLKTLISNLMKHSWEWNYQTFCQQLGIDPHAERSDYLWFKFVELSRVTAAFGITQLEAIYCHVD